MRLRNFTAPNMSEAMRKVRSEFGEDAIVISSLQRGAGSGGGVQVTAAYESAPLAGVTGAPLPGTPLSGTPLSGTPLSATRPGRPQAAAALARSPDEMPDPLAFDQILNAAIEQAPAVPGKPPLKQADLMVAAEDLARILAWHGVPVRLNERLTLSAAGHGLADSQAALARALDEAFRFVPLPQAPARPVVLVGLQGAGKTMACAKLAARAVIAGIRVTVISADTVRSGAVAQLATFVDLLRQPMVTVDSPPELARAVERARDSGPVFIDTPGINPFDKAEIAAMRDLVEAAAGDAVLVMAAGGDPAEAAEIGAVFAEAGARQLFGTRLDGSRRYGGFLAATEDGRLRLANLSIHPYVADGLEAATARSMARLLLRNPEDRDIQAAFGKANA